MSFHHRVHQSTAGLPLINVAGLRGHDPRQVRLIADRIGAAAREFGFFRIAGHGIDPDLIEDTYSAARRFFALPEREKLQSYIGHSRNHRGYVPFTEKGDYADEVNRNYEAFDLGPDGPAHDPDYMAGRLLVGPNTWPELAGFRSTVARYYDQISRLGRLLCGALEMHLDLPPTSLTRHMTKPISQLRLLHYVRAAQTVNHASVNMGAHTDYECLTLLHTRNEGLQVMTQDDKWIDVPVDRKVYVCNIGDMLEAWSNGILRSTPHRVLNLAPERFSMPYFVAANHDTEIRPFPELVARRSMAHYAPFRAGAHLERMLLRDFPYLRQRQRSQQALVQAESSIDNPFEHRIDRTPVA